MGFTMDDLHKHLSNIAPKEANLDEANLERANLDEAILDVRGRDEFDEGHVKGALNIPYTEVANHIEELKKYKKIFIYCRAGRRAQVAAYELYSRGITQIVCIAEGGMPDWIEAGYPVHYADWRLKPLNETTK